MFLSCVRCVSCWLWRLEGGKASFRLLDPADSFTNETAPLDFPMPCDAPVVQQSEGDYAKLSDTGLYCDISLGALDRNITLLCAPHGLWADAAEKSRYMRIPPGTKIDTTDMDGWIFPVGMKVWKEFRMGGKKIETRLLEKRSDKSWLMIAYQWNAEQTDAFPVPDGVVNASGTQHDIPPVAQCLECHSSVADALNGVSALMLARTNFWRVNLSGLASRKKLTRNCQLETSGFLATERCVMGWPISRRIAPIVIVDQMRRQGSSGRPVSWTSRPEDTAAYRTAVNQPLTSWLGHGFTTRVVPGSPKYERGHRPHVDARRGKSDA